MATFLLAYSANPRKVIGVQSLQYGQSLVLLDYAVNDRTVWTYEGDRLFLKNLKDPAASYFIGYDDPPNAGSSLVLQKYDLTSYTQKWRFQASQAGTVIVSVAAPGYAIDDKSQSQQTGNQVWLYPVNGTPAQSWAPEPVLQKMLATEEA